MPRKFASVPFSMVDRLMSGQRSTMSALVIFPTLRSNTAFTLSGLLMPT